MSGFQPFPCRVPCGGAGCIAMQRTALSCTGFVDRLERHFERKIDAMSTVAAALGA